MITQCHYCGYQQGNFIIESPTNGIHGNKIICPNCNKFLGWEKKDKNTDKRPTLKSGTIGEVWEHYGSCCAHCGAHKDDLVQLGIGLTVQHVPPYSKAGEQSILIPYCTWCQERSASDMKRMLGLCDRIKMGFA